MCKLLMLTNTQKIKSMRRLVDAAAALVSETERDGFGYFIQTATGHYGEKTLRPQSFGYSMHRPERSIPFSTAAYERIGKRSKGVGAAVFHGRTSTNHVNLVNTHPITREGWTVCHNGVVTDHGPKYDRLTTNDTEHIAWRLHDGGIKAVEKHLTGYYAFGALDPDGLFHIVKDSTANLFVSYSTDLDSYVFATKETHIVELCTALDVDCSVPAQVNDDVHLTFRRGELLSHASINPRGYSRHEANWSSASLGKSLPVSESVKTSKATSQSTWKSIETLAGYTVDEQLFLAECRDHMDSSYTIEDYKGRPVSVASFRAMTVDEQLTCTVIRPDGTVCDQVNYYHESLFGS